MELPGDEQENTSIMVTCLYKQNIWIESFFFLCEHRVLKSTFSSDTEQYIKNVFYSAQRNTISGNMANKYL